MPAFVIMGALASLSPLWGTPPYTIEEEWATELKKTESCCLETFLIAQKYSNVELTKKVLEIVQYNKNFLLEKEKKFLETLSKLKSFQNELGFWKNLEKTNRFDFLETICLENLEKTNRSIKILSESHSFFKNMEFKCQLMIWRCWIHQSARAAYLWCGILHQSARAAYLWCGIFAHGMEGFSRFCLVT